MLSQWNIKPSALIILSIVVFLMLLIVVLPDVDLPDTAFHRGTDPSTIHALATAAPAMVTIAAVHPIPTSAESYRPFYQAGDLVASLDPNSIPILLRSIRR